MFPADLQARIEREGVVAVLVVDSAGDAVPLARALLAGGISILELTLRTPAALEAVRAIRSEVPAATVGAGTVLSPSQVEELVRAGAAFGVAPGASPGVIASALASGLPFIPGVCTPTEIESSLELGCRLLKYFPAETSGGMRHLAAMAAPYQHLGVRYIPLGGLDQQNAGTYFESPLVAAVGGSWIAERGLVRERAWEAITQRAREATALFRSIRARPKAT